MHRVQLVRLLCVHSEPPRGCATNRNEGVPKPIDNTTSCRCMVRHPAALAGGACGRTQNTIRGTRLPKRYHGGLCFVAMVIRQASFGRHIQKRKTGTNTEGRCAHTHTHKCVCSSSVCALAVDAHAGARGARAGWTNRNVELQKGHVLSCFGHRSEQIIGRLRKQPIPGNNVVGRNLAISIFGGVGKSIMWSMLVPQTCPRLAAVPVTTCCSCPSGAACLHEHGCCLSLT